MEVVIMAAETKKICPECNGEKKIAGNCVCDMEWRGTQKDDEWADCQCTDEEICPGMSGNRICIWRLGCPVA